MCVMVAVALVFTAAASLKSLKAMAEAETAPAVVADAVTPFIWIAPAETVTAVAAEPEKAFAFVGSSAWAVADVAADPVA